MFKHSALGGGNTWNTTYKGSKPAFTVGRGVVQKDFEGNENRAFDFLCNIRAGKVKVPEGYEYWLRVELDLVGY